MNDSICYSFSLLQRMGGSPANAINPNTLTFLPNSRICNTETFPPEKPNSQLSGATITKRIRTQSTLPKLLLRHRNPSSQFLYYARPCCSSSHFWLSPAAAPDESQKSKDKMAKESKKETLWQITLEQLSLKNAVLICHIIKNQRFLMIPISSTLSHLSWRHENKFEEMYCMAR